MSGGASAGGVVVAIFAVATMMSATAIDVAACGLGTPTPPLPDTVFRGLVIGSHEVDGGHNVDFRVLEVFRGAVDESVSLRWYWADPPPVGGPVEVVVYGSTARFTTDCDPPAVFELVTGAGYAPRSPGWLRAHLVELLAGTAPATVLIIASYVRWRRRKTASRDAA